MLHRFVKALVRKGALHPAVQQVGAALSLGHQPQIIGALVVPRELTDMLLCATDSMGAQPPPELIGERQNQRDACPFVSIIYSQDVEANAFRLFGIIEQTVVLGTLDGMDDCI